MYPLHAAITAQDLNQVRKLLREGIDVNQKDNDGDTPLHLASAMGQLETVRLLIENGAEVDLQDGWDLRGRTPLHRAVIGGHIDVIRVLVRAGADVNAKRWDGYSALSWAKARNQSDIVTLLKELGTTG